MWLPVQDIYGTAPINVDPPGVSLTAEPLLLGTKPANSFAGISDSTVGGFALSTHYGHVVKRIVGQIHIAVNQSAATDDIRTIVAAGICVDRVDETGALQNLTAWDPTTENSKQKRWLWLRSWILNNLENYTEATDAYPFPGANSDFSDIRSGNHVDWKGTAKVGYEERMFLIVKTFNETAVAEAATLGQAYYHAVLRAYGYVGQVNTR